MASHLKVLIGDSEAWAVDMFTQAARRHGVEIRHARNGVEAVEMFKTLAPSLVILDTLLPKLDGLQVAHRLREMELGRITPIVVTSAIYRHGPDVERLRRKFGFTDFLEKPFRLDDATRLLGDYLHDEGEAPATGDDAFEDGEPVRLPALAETPLGDLGVPALLCQLFRARKSGILTLRSGEITKVLFFERGQVTHARSNSRRDRLGRLLLRNKKVTLEDYQRARRIQVGASEHVPLGAALIQAGVLSENDVLNAVSSQILAVVFGLFGWREGTWSFLETSNIPPEYGRFTFNTANLIFWGLRQLEGREDFGRFLPSARVRVERPVDRASLKDSLHLTYFEEQILALVDGRRRLGEILSMGRLAQIDVERVVFSLLVLGVLQVSAEGAGMERPVLAGALADEQSVDQKGSLLATSVARLFSRLYLSGLSGVVSLRRDGHVTDVFFEGGDIVNARSTAEEFRLGQILLRAKKITPEEHDVATRRLGETPGRKIGSIFLELKALSLEELDWALRFQVQAIVLDLFGWREGEYAFSPGDVPADLMVTLDATTPNLIMEGVRTTDAPPGIARLLENDDQLLMKLWGEERVAGLLQLSSAERRLLSYVEAGRSVRDVRSLGLLGDVELARTLHGLLALEVVRVTPASGPGRAATPTRTEELLASLGENDDTPLPLEPLAVASEVELTGEFDLTGSGIIAPVPGRTAPAAPAPAPAARHEEQLRKENEELRRRLESLEKRLGEAGEEAAPRRARRGRSRRGSGGGGI